MKNILFIFFLSINIFSQNDTENIRIALEDGWVITFPQGTTTPFKPIRRGTAHIIKTYKPVVVPIVIDGFRRSFDKCQGTETFLKTV